jgi:hypothetical protein
MQNNITKSLPDIRMGADHRAAQYEEMLVETRHLPT